MAKSLSSRKDKVIVLLIYCVFRNHYYSLSDYVTLVICIFLLHNFGDIF